MQISSGNVWINVLAVIDALPFYVLLVDENHCIVEANTAVWEHLGVKREDILGQYCPKVVHGIDGPFYGCPLEESVQTGRPIEKEVLDEKSGRWLSSAIYPTSLVTEEGEKIYFHMVLDISGRKQAEEELAVSRERLRSLSAHLESMVEEERKKIAHDLHDETSQILASLNAHLETAIKKLSSDADEIRTILKKAQNFSVQILDQLHRLIYQLRPTILDDLGLVAAINWLIENNLQVAGIKVDFKVVNKEKILPPEVRIVIFRVVQEAINNIAKHARAKRVTVRLHFKKNSVRFIIRDNGVGFGVEEAINSKDRPRGLGLVGMIERVESINGAFNIQSGNNSGTEISFEIPYENRAVKTNLV